MKPCLAALLLATACTLGACGNSISTNDQPITGDHPAPAPPDTVTALDTAPPVGGPVPFVNPDRARRGRVIRHPSPPASRTH